MKTKLVLGLGTDAGIYENMTDVYATFSSAQDSPGLIVDHLNPLLKNNDVLDLGCGNGKYAKLFDPTVKSYLGLDISASQLERARVTASSYPYLSFTQGDVSQIPLPDNSVDSVVSMWCLESLWDSKKQVDVIDEAKRVLRTGGQMYVIENSGDSEFDAIIRRTPDHAITDDFRELLFQNGFAEDVRLHSYFQFESKEIAQQTFGQIWGRDVSEKVKCGRIEQGINIYKLEAK